MTACVDCGAAVDPRLDRAQIVSGRIVHRCCACAGAGTDTRGGRARAASQSCCARCGSEIPLYEARPMLGAGVGADGRIPLACAVCAERGGEVEAADAGDSVPVAAPQPAWRRHVSTAVALAAAGLMATMYLRSHAPPRAAVADSLRAQATIPIGSAAIGVPGSAGVVADEARTGAAHRGALPGELVEAESEHDDHGFEDEGFDLFEPDTELPPTIEDVLESSEEPLEALLPTLNDWVFPVLDSDEAFPLKRTRQFGAVRDGVARSECGKGHCGVDLDGPRGTPVVAVAWGVVTRIERRSDRRSGKYVRIEHPDYVYTAYMHLDDIAEDLRVGDEVDPGTLLGTLGRTGIKHSAPHLHFSLSVPSGGRLVHIDPMPYLFDAERLPAD